MLGDTTKAARLTHLAECTPFDASDGVTKDVRLTTAKAWCTRSGDTPANAIYHPGLGIEGFGTSIVDMESAFLGGLIEARSGEIFVPNPHGRFDEWLRYSWLDRVLTVYKVNAGAAHSSRTVRYKGYVTGCTVSPKEARLAFESFNAKLTRSKVTESKFWGRPRALNFVSASTSHRVNCGDNCDMTGSWTLEALVKIASNVADAVILQKGDGSNGYELSTGPSTGNELRGAVRNLGSTQSVDGPGGTLVIGVWALVTAVFDSVADTLTLYKDGVQIGQTTGVTITAPNTAQVLMFGANPSASGRWFNGQIAEVRIWNVARTQLQINQHLYGGLTTGASGLIGWWRMVEGTGATVNDETATNADGTITGATWVGTYEGDEALAGRRRPWGIGGPRHAEMLLIDANKLIYAVDVRGFQTLSTPSVYDGGVALTSEGDNSDLWSASVTAGSYKFDRSRGLVRLGSTPTNSFRLSCTYQSANVGAGSFQSIRPWTAIEAILIESAGFSSSDIDSTLVQTTTSTSFSGWGSSCNIALHSPDGEMLCSDAISHILKASRARGGFEDDGVFRAKDLTKANVPNTAVGTLSENDGHSLVVLATLPPIKEILLRHTPYWPAHSAGEIAGAVTETTNPSRSDLQKPYREKRFLRPLDRFGRSFANYNKDARQIVEEINTGAVNEAQLGIYADAQFDAHDTYGPVWGYDVLHPSKDPKAGEVWTLSHPRLEAPSVKTMVAGRSQSIRGSRVLTKVQLMDVTTLAA